MTTKIRDGSNTLSRRRLLLVHPEGLLGDVILAALGDCGGITIVDDIANLGERETLGECVCIVFGPSSGHETIRARLRNVSELSSLVVIVDHQDPHITVFHVSSPRIERRRMGMSQFIAEVRTALDGDCPWEPSARVHQSDL